MISILCSDHHCLVEIRFKGKYITEGGYFKRFPLRLLIKALLKCIMQKEKS